MPQPNVILEALETILKSQPGCPICHYGRQTGRKFMDGILYESVNDYGLRQQLAQSLGFCTFHSQEMLTFPGAKLGAAIIEQAMLKEALRQIDGMTRARRPRFGIGKKNVASVAPPDEQSCMVCQFERNHERMAITDLVKHWDATWAEHLQNAGGMCLQHLAQTLLLAPKPMQQTLKQMHNTLWQTHIAHLDEFIRKQDYRFQDEMISQEEGLASRRTIAILTGEPRSNGAPDS
jgi:hypothetical protein